MQSSAIATSPRDIRPPRRNKIALDAIGPDAERRSAGTTAGSELWFLDDAPIMGGGQRFALKLALAAAARTPPIRSVMVCPAESLFALQCQGAGFETHHAEFPSVSPPSIRAPAAVLALRRLLATAPPSAIFVANSPRTQAYAAAAHLFSQDDRPIVNLAHEQDTAARRVARATFRHGGRLVAIGTNSASVYERALPGVKVRKINNVLDDHELESASGARARAVRLAVLARMIPEKGIIELLDEVAASSQCWSTLAIGASPQDRDYEARVKDHISALGLTGRARLLGAISDVASFLDSADVLVVPSTGCEGQPTAIIEALARGLPVLVREPILSDDFGGMPVQSYRNAADFGAALHALRPAPPSVEDMRRRFGADQAITGLLEAAAGPLP
jgi:glycosyltransferase involved in cell wall biosynthesis